jgi:hypothetical protein
MSNISVTGFSSVKQIVSPEKFLKILKRRPNAIKNSHFIAPKLGKKNDFGKIEVEYFYGAKR